MTSQDNLRERMAEIIDAALVAWNTDMDTQDSEGKYAAQAVIDEFGLTVDRAVDTGNRSYDKRTGIITNGWKYRVVGKWEKQ